MRNKMAKQKLAVIQLGTFAMLIYRNEDNTIVGKDLYFYDWQYVLALNVILLLECFATHYRGMLERSTVFH